MKIKQKILVVQVAALSWDIMKSNDAVALHGLNFSPIDSVFPAVTCTAQASFRTATAPAQHGMTANGLFNKQLKKVLFWEQSASQIAGSRIWDNFRKNGNTVGMMFWQQILGESVDLIISPAPIHKHHGGMIQNCYSKPADVYSFLEDKMKRSFNLLGYWGPLASPKSSQWIADATCVLLNDREKSPDLLFTYLPALDYDLQRFGPDDSRCQRAWELVSQQLKQLINATRQNDYEILVFGDYAITPCDHGAVYPNKALLNAGLLAVRDVRKMQYLDLYDSRAFAVADHEIAHIHVADHVDIPAARQALIDLPGVEKVMDKVEQEHAGVANQSSGELLAVVKDGYWMSYRWWDKPEQAPDYASHVDIHNKPGFDPCELFFGWPPGSITSNESRIGGTHGKIGSGRQIAWASSCINSMPDNLIELAGALQDWINSKRETNI